MKHSRVIVLEITEIQFQKVSDVFKSKRGLRVAKFLKDLGNPQLDGVPDTSFNLRAFHFMSGVLCKHGSIVFQQCPFCVGKLRGWFRSRRKSNHLMREMF